MGSYANLKFGHFQYHDWKSFIPLQPILMFSAEDYRESVLNGEDGEDEEDRIDCHFCVSAQTARRRMNERGFSLEICRQLFEEFRSEFVMRFDKATSKFNDLPNTIDFDTFLAAFKRLHDEQTSWYSALDSHAYDEDPVLGTLVNYSFFDESSAAYFEDAIDCVTMRAFLEVVPDETLVIFDVTELLELSESPDESVKSLYRDLTDRMLRRIRLDYQLYGFVLEDDPSVDERLRTRIEGFTEDQFINHVLIPLLDRMGFQRIRKVRFHGRNEFGADILPFRHQTPLGTLEYYAVQAKAVRIHGTSATSGNAGELISQATQALSVSFIDDIDNERKSLDKFVIASSKAITPDARQVIESAIEGKRRLIFLDNDRIVELVKEHHLLQYLLFNEFN